jgi:hypothetical protein
MKIYSRYAFKIKQFFVFLFRNCDAMSTLFKSNGAHRAVPPKGNKDWSLTC